VAGSFGSHRLNTQSPYIYMLVIDPYLSYATYLALSGIFLVFATILYQEKTHIRYFLKQCNLTALPTNDRCSAKVLEIIKTLPSRPYRVVDFGCGEGDMLHKIDSNTDIHDIVGVELDEALAQNTMERFKSSNNIVVHNMDMVHYTFESVPTIVYMYEPLFRMSVDDAIPIYKNVFLNLSKNNQVKYIIYVSGVKQMLPPAFFETYNYSLLDHCKVSRFIGLAANHVYLYKSKPGALRSVYSL